MNHVENEYSKDGHLGLYTTEDNESMSETSSTNIKHLDFYYRNVNTTDSYISNQSDQITNINNKLNQPAQRQKFNSEVCCRICNNKSSKGNFIILSCNHVFHVQCLAETHFVDIYKFAVIDSEYFETRKCQCCGHQFQTEELMFLHSKFLSITKDRLEYHQTAVTSLEERMNKLKEDLKVCYEYKHKLECDREKSKKIVNTLMTMLP
jgi:hypothetical protein